ELVGGLQALANDAALHHEDTSPMAIQYRETAAMADAALRLFPAFPEAPGSQLQLCEGLEGILAVVAERLAGLSATLERQSHEAGHIDALADLFFQLAAGNTPDIKHFVALAEAVLDEAKEGRGLRFLPAEGQEPARFVACHSLTTAQVMARLIHHDPEL